MRRPVKRPTKPNYLHWGKQRAVWSVRDAAYLFVDLEPDSGLSTEALKMMEAIVGWFAVQKGKATVLTKATPQEFIAMADHYEVSVPPPLRNAITQRLESSLITSNQNAPDSVYTTPYLELMHEAIVEHKITRKNQPKKAFLSEKFQEKKVAGKKISQNIGDAMATLIRLPESQAGAGKAKKQG